ncbi:MAG: serine/threonine protein kinase [Pseudomonadota bacterium]
MIINRGSRIIANGTADAPITFTSVSDALQDPTNPIDPEAVQQWGGIVINGFGISNKCEYTGTRGVDLALVGECSIEAEGSAGDDESQYGGTNDEDSSGILRYVVVKHTGATVGSGDELNGISFGGVGNGTVIENLQVYSTFDDGVEMFGGSVDITNLVALYVRDDSIDIDEGYNGTITNALVIQQEGDGNHCIESDGIGSYDSTDVAGNQDLIDRGLNSAPTINNLTCIVSANGGGTHDPGAGWLFREGIEPIVNDAVLVSSYGANDTGAGDDNYCLGITDDETHAAADGDTLQLNSVIYACQENFLGTAWGAFANEQEFAEAEGNQFATVADGTAVDASDAADPDLTLFTGTLKIQSLPWNQLAVDAAAADPNTTPTSGEATDILGGFGDMDWATGWTYGLDADNRGQALWFE